MTDKELLTLATKAAGIEIVMWDERDKFFLIGETFVGIPETQFSHWNPLESDGDALRLAVKLELLVCCESYSAMAPKDGDRGQDDWCSGGDVYDDDPIAATRRAIVICAAQIGKAIS